MGGGGAAWERGGETSGLARGAAARNAPPGSYSSLCGARGSSGYVVPYGYGKEGLRELLSPLPLSPDPSLLEPPVFTGWNEKASHCIPPFFLVPERIRVKPSLASCFPSCLPTSHPPPRLFYSLPPTPRKCFSQPYFGQSCTSWLKEWDLDSDLGLHLARLTRLLT